MSELITEEQLKRALPRRLSTNINAELVDTVNQVIDDPIYREHFKDNLLSYTSVMQDGRYKIIDYVNAVKYVSYKLLGSSNVEAYCKTFPERYSKLLENNTDKHAMSAYVAAYNKNQLVNKIYEQTLVPTHILNADLHQKAINVQAELMMTAKSEKVRMDAANSLLTHLKMPETTKIELDMNVKADKSIDELRATTMQLVAQQKAMLKAGAMNAKDVAHSKLLIEDGEVIDG